MIPRTRKSSNFFNVAPSSNELKSFGKSNLKSRKMSLQIKKPSLKYIKNRSISLVIKRLNRKAPVILRRTLSDFHECPKVRLNVSSELFSGVNLFKQIEITETDKFENIEISVSDEVSSMGNQL